MPLPDFSGHIGKHIYDARPSLPILVTECDSCGDSVTRTWHRGPFGAEAANEETRRLCAACHPELSGAERDEPARASEPQSVIMTDGGSAACPDCAGYTVNGQGLYDCLDCDWTGLR